MTAPAAKAAPSCHSFTIGHVRVQAGHSKTGHEKLYGSAAHCSGTGVPNQPASGRSAPLQRRVLPTPGGPTAPLSQSCGR